VAGRIVLAHLSDIHFRFRAGGDVWDFDAPLRDELERDLARVVEETGPFRGFVVTGDVAFSGAPDEYARAGEWLASVATITGCRENDVWMVPGNHDVVRSVVSESRTIQEFHSRLRTCEPKQIDSLLYEYLIADKTGGNAYLAPLENYAAFATRYECSISAERPFWDREIDIGDSGYRLRMHGMTSALISDGLDDIDGNRLVVGSAQAMVRREPGTIVMTLSHHPAYWLRDGETVIDHLRTRAQIQLWGHSHLQRARVLDGNLHLFAGAVHPQRDELDWEPRYNVLVIEVDEITGQASATLAARVWKQQESRFAPDFDSAGERYQTYPLTVEPHIVAVQEEIPATIEAAETPSQLGDARRTLAFHFSSLPYQRRLSVARQLDLLDPDTRDVRDQDLFETVLGRAVRTHLLAELWSAVLRERAIPEGENPFAQHQQEGGP
jgi:hypothetical protein